MEWGNNNYSEKCNEIQNHILFETQKITFDINRNIQFITIDI